MSKIYRQSVLDRLSSPEQLDTLMRVTNSRAWLIMIGSMLIVSLTIIWSIYGRLSTTVVGEGILIKSGGIHDIVTVGSGQISAIYVTAGDKIQKGQVVARVAQPEIRQQIEKAKSQQKELRRQHKQLLALGSEGTKLRANMVVGQRANLLSVIRSDRERLSWLTQHAQKQEGLLKQGLLTNQAVEATRQEIRQIRAQITNSRNQLQSLSVSDQESTGQKERETLRSQLRLNEAAREIERLNERLELASRVVSAHSGRVLEVRAAVGEIVGPGRSLITVEPAGSEGLGLEAMVYVPVDQGKSLKPGMRVQVSPRSIKREEFGVMVGIVTQVSEFPSTQAGMKRVLQNDLLVQSLLQKIGLAPIAVKAELVPDTKTKSGYQWTSKKGPPIPVGPGTPCSATIAVRQSRPIEMVIPALRKFLGV